MIIVVVCWFVLAIVVGSATPEEVNAALPDAWENPFTVSGAEPTLNTSTTSVSEAATAIEKRKATAAVRTSRR